MPALDLIRALAGARIHDVTVALRKGVASWPGEDFWRFEPVCRMSEGAPCNVSKFAMGCHLGTHVDSPWHFGKGEKTIESIGFDQMIVPARVLDLTDVEVAVSREHLEGRIDGIARTGGGVRAAWSAEWKGGAVLTKTRNSGTLASLEPFREEFVHLDASAADYLVEKGIRTVGVDYLSVEGFRAVGAPVHHRLLGADVFIVEGLDLSDVPEGDYLLVVLPLKIEGSDGAPARAILVGD